jgi:signal transduction histidine kinase
LPINDDTDNKDQQQNIERTEIIHGQDNILSRTIDEFNKIKGKFDNCTDTSGPIIFFKSPIGSEFVKLKNRGIKLRFLTNITRQNMDYCRDLIEIVELRHLDGIRGNFGIIDEKHYGSIGTVKEGHPPLELILSNVTTFVQQQQFLFETLWSKSIPAALRIKQLENGLEEILQTKVVENYHEIIKEISIFAEKSKRIKSCSTINGIRLSHDRFYESYKQLSEKYGKRQHEGIRWVTSINNKEDIETLRKYGKVEMQIRHVNDVSFFNFSLSDNRVLSTIDKMEEGEMVTSVLVSTDPLYINHYNSIFEKMWKSGIDAETRIKDIEEGRQARIEIIQNSQESLDLVKSLVKSTKREILAIVSTSNSIVRMENNGSFDLFNRLAHKGIKVKVLAPGNPGVKEYANKVILKYPNIAFRELPFALPFLIGATITDEEKVTLFEIKDDHTNSYNDAIGLTILMDVKSIALSYASIFDSLWKQTDLYEQIAKNQKTQQEFIQVAAHELRNPVQSLLGFANILLSQNENTFTYHKNNKIYIKAIERNARRLKRLIELVLDVAQIDNNSLILTKELFNLDEIVSSTVKKYQNQMRKNKKVKNVEIIYIQEPNEEKLTIFADKDRIRQVIISLLDTSLAFTKDEEGKNGGTAGIITIITKKEINPNEATVRINDSGHQIPPEVQSMLFTKLITGSIEGTGLGLYLSKKIIESHGGRISAASSEADKGTTFSFSLPLV